MTIENLLSRLTKVKSRTHGNWIACCPAHDDKTPSMTIREVDDGRILVHCFGGCSAEEIMGAAGLEMSELFPERLADATPMRRPFNSHNVLEALDEEALVVCMSAEKIHNGTVLSKADMDRLWVAKGRIAEGRRLANGER